MTGARTARARRIAETTPLITQLRAYGYAYDTDWHTRRVSDHAWFELTTPLAVCDRGDTAVNESNFAIAEARLEAASAFGVTYRYDLWPGGCIRTLVVRADDAAALSELHMILSSLADYPLLDEYDAAERQWHHNHPDGDNRSCYTQDDCACTYRTHHHTLDIRENDTGYPWCGVCYLDVEDWPADRHDHRDPRPARQPRTPDIP